MACSDDELTGFEYARAKGDGGIVYEFIIPLHKADDQLFGYEKNNQKKIALGLECKAPERDKGGRGSGEVHDGEMPRGGEMREGGEMRRGGMSSQKDYNLWVKIEFKE